METNRWEGSENRKGGRKITKQTNKKNGKQREKVNTIALIIVALRPQRVSVSVQQCSIESWQSTPVSVEWGMLVLDVPGL